MAFIAILAVDSIPNDACMENEPYGKGAMPTALRGHAEQLTQAWPLRAVAMAPSGSLTMQPSLIRYK
jgi:hypothetical protein